MKFPIFVLMFSCAATALAICECESTCRCSQCCSYCQLNNVTILCLSGTKTTMGISYGSVLKAPLSHSLTILKTFYIDEHNGTHEEMVFKAKRWHRTYSTAFMHFLSGISNGSGLSLEDVLVLNAMESIRPPNTGKDSACLFASIPGAKKLLARNYDFFAPYDKVSSNMVVTILREHEKTVTAFIGMPGQVYCPTCVNAAGLFTEFNDGKASGGSAVYERQTLLIKTLEYMQNSDSFEDLVPQYKGTAADRPLIVNTASASETISYEFSAERSTFYSNTAVLART